MKMLRYVLLFLTFFCGQSVHGFSFKDISKGLNTMRAMVSSLLGTQYHRLYLSSECADAKTKRMAREIMLQMGITDPNAIEVRYLNDTGFDIWGMQNCIATTNTIFIDRSWFNSLSHEEQEFLLAHEAAHIKNKDNQKMLAIIMLFGAACGYQMYEYIQNKASVGSLAFLGITSAFLVPAYSRMQEQRADLDGAKAIRSTVGGLVCTKKWLKYGRQKTDMFATHPCNQQRIEALEQLECELASG